MFTSAVVSIVIRNTILRKVPPSVVSSYGERSINLNKVVATFENHTFLSQTELTRTGIISICICIKYVDGSTSGFYFDGVGCAMRLSRNVGEQF